MTSRLLVAGGGDEEFEKFEFPDSRGVKGEKLGGFEAGEKLPPVPSNPAKRTLSEEAGADATDEGASGDRESSWFGLISAYPVDGYGVDAVAC